MTRSEHAPARLRRGRQDDGLLRRTAHTVWESMPRGNTLDEETFASRHRLLSWILAVHVPALFAFGVWQGYGVSHSAVEVVVPAVSVAFARLARNRRLAGFFVTAGLVYCSSVLVHLSGGTIEAHFHFFILIGLIALYQDWVPFMWNVAFTVLSHGIGSTIAGDLMFNHDAAQNRPWSWAVIHGAAVLAACIGVVVFWKHTELVQQRNTHLAADLATAESTAAQRQSVSELFVNLARRNQSLLDRQLSLIAELEQRERTPDVLADLFKLDHLATRIRRNAESLLVLSGEEAPRRWGRPIPLADVVRAAAAEVEDYGRVEVLVNDHLVVAGRVVADLAHLLAELIENATTFSPPGADVRVVSHLAPGPATHLLSVEDVGVGMAAEALAEANAVLAAPPEIDLRQPRLGLHVVGRLAQRYGIGVQLAPTPGGGLTALVALPVDLVSERHVDELVPAGAPAAAGAGSAGAAPTRPPPGPLPPIPLATTERPPHESAYARAQAPWTSPPPLPPLPPVSLPPSPRPPVAGTSLPASPVTADGLARRVPGASLASSLRRDDTDASPARWGAPPVGSGGATPQVDRDAERMRTMLSRFQSRQRAGRQAAQQEVTPDRADRTTAEHALPRPAEEEDE